jgi:hypothetical protein
VKQLKKKAAHVYAHTQSPRDLRAGREQPKQSNVTQRLAPRALPLLPYAL